MVKLTPVPPPPPRRSGGPGLTIVLICIVLAGVATLGVWNYWNKKYKTGATDGNATNAPAAAKLTTNNNPIARAAAILSKVTERNKEGEATADAVKPSAPPTAAGAATSAKPATGTVKTAAVTPGKPAPAPVVVSAAPPGSKPWSSIPGMPKLQGILFSKEPTAIIDGKSVRAGDEIGGAKVVEIKRTSVRMELNGEVHEVTIK